METPYPKDLPGVRVCEHQPRREGKKNSTTEKEKESKFFAMKKFVTQFAT
jgi:hypothetical protein